MKESEESPRSVATEPSSSPAVAMEEVEKLRLQLLWTEMNSVQQQIRILQGDLLQAEQLLKTKILALQEMRTAVEKKYGIDANVTTFDAEGRFIPITDELRKAAVMAAMQMRF